MRTTKRFTELQNGVVGATLKSILATKTVIFIGFSFGDKDFAQIINYLKDEMGNLFPHIYIVTLDKTLEERLAYKNFTSIVTSGTFFLHQLKLELIEYGIITNHSIRPVIITALDLTEELHNKISEIDLHRYPCAIYARSYQDGIIHAFERFLQNYETGEYNQPGYVGRMAKEYEKMVEKYMATENYWNAAYYEDYLNGLILIGSCENGKNILDKFPFLFLPNAKQPLTTYDIFMDELIRISGGKSKYQKQAKKIVAERVVAGLVVHHPPY